MRSARLIGLLSLVAATCRSRETPRQQVQASSPSERHGLEGFSDSDTVNLGGYYSLDGNVPPWSNIEVVNISWGQLLPAPGAALHDLHLPFIGGSVRLKVDSGQAAIDLDFIKASLDGRHFTFATDAHDSLSYDFSGDFLLLGEFPSSRTGPFPVLAGHLRKLKGGVVVAEADVKFTYFAGD